MKCCTFCSNEAEMLFNHMIHEIGSLCLECYVKIQGCSVCSESFMPDPDPDQVEEETRYSVKAKYIGMGDKNIIVCDGCFESIRLEFPEMIR